MVQRTMSRKCHENVSKLSPDAIPVMRFPVSRYHTCRGKLLSGKLANATMRLNSAVPGNYLLHKCRRFHLFASSSSLIALIWGLMLVTGTIDAAGKSSGKPMESVFRGRSSH